MPLEIITDIFQRLDDQDLSNIRLTCKCFHTKVHITFAKRCFQYRCHMLNEHSLEALREISNNPAFNTMVHELRICTFHLNAEPEYARDLPLDYYQYTEEQEEFHRHGLDIALLAQALGNFPNCSRIEIANDLFKPWGFSTLAQRIAPHPNEHEEPFWSWAEDVDVVKRAVRVLLTAIIASNSQPKELCILMGGDNCSTICISHLDLPVMTATQVKLHFTQLEHLHLIAGFDEYDVDPEVLIGQYIQFVSLFPHISRFTMDFAARVDELDADEGEARFRSMSAALDIPNLQALKICCAMCNTDAVLQLLQRHPCLKTLELDGVDVVDGDKKAWQSFLRRI
jgi:hypothetical protein